MKEEKVVLVEHKPHKAAKSGFNFCLGSFCSRVSTHTCRFIVLYCQLNNVSQKTMNERQLQDIMKQIDRIGHGLLQIYGAQQGAPNYIHSLF